MGHRHYSKGNFAFPDGGGAWSLSAGAADLWRKQGPKRCAKHILSEAKAREIFGPVSHEWAVCKVCKKPKKTNCVMMRLAGQVESWAVVRGRYLFVVLFARTRSAICALQRLVCMCVWLFRFCSHGILAGKSWPPQNLGHSSFDPTLQNSALARTGAMFCVFFRRACLKE